MDINEIAGFSIHPELIHIGPATAESQQFDPQVTTAFEGIIEEVFYQGNFSEITVLIKEIEKPLVVHRTRGAGQEVKLSEGQDVIVSWESRRNNVLRK